MQILHETPILTRDDIRRALNPVPAVPPDPTVPVNGSILPGGFALLSAADLAEQAEQIRITPQYLSTEEISKLWAATKANYRATCAYHVSVVLIESRRAARAALPVRRRNLLVLPLERPQIDRVAPQAVASGATLTLTGRNLRAELTKVNVGGVEVDPATLGRDDAYRRGAGVAAPRREHRAGRAQARVRHRRACRPAPRLRVERGRVHADPDDHGARDRRARHRSRDHRRAARRAHAEGRRAARQPRIPAARRAPGLRAHGRC